jgi:hypothetical protein
MFDCIGDGFLGDAVEMARLYGGGGRDGRAREIASANHCAAAGIRC